MYPLKDGVPFFIRSGMKGNKMDLMWERARDDEVKEQHRLFMRQADNENSYALWSFDARTRTIRAHKKRTHVIGQENGRSMDNHLRLGYFMNHRYQRMKWYKGQTMNLRNEAGRCLTTQNGVDYNDKRATPVRYIHCGFGKNLSNAWDIVKFDKNLDNKYKFPVKDGERFIIRSKLPGNKIIKWNKNLGEIWDFST